MLQVIKQETLIALGEEAGLDPTRVAQVEITPREATFTVYSVNIRGEKMVARDRESVITHWVKSYVV